jgi:cell division protein FtsB
MQRSFGSTPKERPRESRDPLVRKYAGYRARAEATPESASGSPAPPEPPSSSPRGRPTGDSLPAPLRPDRGLRSRTGQAAPPTTGATLARPAEVRDRREPTESPHRIDRSWFLRRRLGTPRRLVPVALALGTAWLALSLVFGANGLVRLWELRAREAELEAELDGLEAAQEDLRWELSEPAPMALERSARETFDLQRPGEIVYRFPRTPASSGTDSDAPGSTVSTNEPTAGVDTPEGRR